MALAGSEERAGCGGSASVSTIHAPFPTEVECKCTVTHLRISSRTTLAERLDALDAAASPRLRIVCRNLGPSCRWASYSSHAKGLRRPDCA
jgi:hypothetical protein